MYDRHPDAIDAVEPGSEFQPVAGLEREVEFLLDALHELEGEILGLRGECEAALEAFREAISTFQKPAIAEKNLAALTAGKALINP